MIPKRQGENRALYDFIVDKAYWCHGDPEMCRAYRKKSACERMKSRAERLFGRNMLRGLAKTRVLVGMVLMLLLLTVAVSFRRGRPELAKSIEYYASQ